MNDYVATKSFSELPLSDELRRGIADRGYDAPTPVQAAVLGPILAGRDVICRSKTGTGKTAAFGIPTLERIPAGTRKPSALILCNTRELALQVCDEIKALGKHKDLRVTAIYGGASMGAQLDALDDGAEVIVGTPGRVFDHIRRGTLKLDGIRIAVLDEADEMLSAGFYEEVTRILGMLPKDRQVLLFSATIPPDIEQIVQKYLREPETILLSGDTFTVDHIQNVVFDLSDAYPKPRNLLYLIEREDPDGAIIFCNTRTDTELIANVLNRNGLDAEMLNGDLPQKERERVMGKIKRGELKFMVATDIAARGIDISDLSHVINYSLPEDPAVYLHRVGRTGRIGKKGTALSLVSGAELVTLSALEKKYNIKFEKRKLPTPEEARKMWTDKHVTELRQAMQSGVAFEAFLPLAQDLAANNDGKLLIAYALRYFFTHHRMERAQMRAAAEKHLHPPAPESGPAVEAGAEPGLAPREEREGRKRRDREREPRKPRPDRSDRSERKPRAEAESAEGRGESKSTKTRLYVDQGSTGGWDDEALAAALAELSGQPRDAVLAVKLRDTSAYVDVKPEAKDAFLGVAGKPLKDKPLRIEVARPPRRR